MWGSPTAGSTFSVWEMVTLVCMRHFTDLKSFGILQEGMLARFAAALQRGQIQGIGGQGFGGGGGTIVVDDNCLVCRSSPSPDLKPHVGFVVAALVETLVAAMP